MTGEIKKNGPVNHIDVVTDDRTAEHIDLTARLRNLQLSEKRISEFFKESVGSIQDLISTEKELTRVRESIEKIQSELDSLNGRVAYNTIELRLNTDYVEQIKHATTAQEQLVETTTQSLQNFLQAMLSLTKLVILLAPWASVGGTMFTICLFAMRLFRKRSSRLSAQDV